MPKSSNKLTIDQLGRLIYEIRGERVMLDSDLASIYGVETKALNRAVKRNRDRFPEDFVFQVSENEWKNLRYQIGTASSGRERQSLRYQIGTSSLGHGGRRSRPYVFTEHGAIMADNVLNPESFRGADRRGACPERSRTGGPRVSQNARLARRQTRSGEETCSVGKGTEKATRRSRSRYCEHFATGDGHNRSAGHASTAKTAHRI
jgi:ORF6N domain